MSRTPQERRVSKARDYYSAHPDVRERGDETREGRVIAVDDDGLIRVQWKGTARPGTHTEDELITPRTDRAKKQYLPGVVDAFADVREFLGSDADDDSDNRGAAWPAD